MLIAASYDRIIVRKEAATIRTNAFSSPEYFLGSNGLDMCLVGVSSRKLLI